MRNFPFASFGLKLIWGYVYINKLREYPEIALSILNSQISQYCALPSAHKYSLLLLDVVLNLKYCKEHYH